MRHAQWVGGAVVGFLLGVMVTASSVAHGQATGTQPGVVAGSRPILGPAGGPLGGAPPVGIQPKRLGSCGPACIQLDSGGYDILLQERDRLQGVLKSTNDALVRLQAWELRHSHALDPIVAKLLGSEYPVFQVKEAGLATQEMKVDYKTQVITSAVGATP